MPRPCAASSGSSPRRASCSAARCARTSPSAGPTRARRRSTRRCARSAPSEMIAALPDGLETEVGERGTPALRRRAADRRLRAGAARRAGDPDPRRGDLERRRPHRAPDRAGPAPAARRPQRDRHRAPALDDSQRSADRRPRRRADRRERHARGADRRRRRLRPPIRVLGGRLGRRLTRPGRVDRAQPGAMPPELPPPPAAVRSRCGSRRRSRRRRRCRCGSRRRSRRRHGRRVAVAAVTAARRRHGPVALLAAFGEAVLGSRAGALAAGRRQVGLKRADGRRIAARGRLLLLADDARLLGERLQVDVELPGRILGQAKLLDALQRVPGDALLLAQGSVWLVSALCAADASAVFASAQIESACLMN